MRVFVLYLLMFTAVNANSQNYEIITPAVDRFFIAETGNITGIRIKQTVTLPDGYAYYNFSVLRSVSDDYDDMYDCAYKVRPSWLGEKVIALNDGTHTLFNKNHDSVFIHTIAEISDKWTLYTDTAGNYIEAVLTDIIEDSVLQATDSVKIISLQHKDSFGNNISGNWNGKEIRLSKNYGWIKTFNIYEFPDTIIEYEITEKGIPTYTDIFDYSVGDTIQFYRNSVTYYSGNRHVYVTQIVLSKNISLDEDTVSYTFHRDSLIYNIPKINQGYPPVYGDTIVTRFTDTVSAQYFNIPVYSTMPNEYIYGGNGGDFFSYSLFFTDYFCEKRLITRYGNYNVYTEDDTCILRAIDGWNDIMAYIAGVGMQLYNVTHGSGFFSRDLNYLSGCSLSEFYTNIREVDTQKIFGLYPNPASSKLFISYNYDVSTEIKIFDLNGRLVYENKNTDIVDVSGWQNGLYIVEITQGNSKDFKKLVVNN